MVDGTDNSSKDASSDTSKGASTEALESIKNFWPEFGDTEKFDVLVSKLDVTESSNSLAYDVLTAYEIQCEDIELSNPLQSNDPDEDAPSNRSVVSKRPGSLANLDIKSMDAIQVIKLSLLEMSSTTNSIYEPIMQSDGIVKFVIVGENTTTLSEADIYYEIQTGIYKEENGGVMVTGGRPLAYRRSVAWSPIWRDGPKELYDTGILHNDCIDGGFNQNCSIVFTDPHLDSRYQDGIDNLYEITSGEVDENGKVIKQGNHYDSIIGYAKYIYWPNAENDKNAQVTRHNTAKVIVELAAEEGDTLTLGTLAKRPSYADAIFTNPSCYDGQGVEVSFKNGVLIPIPEEFRFESVRETKVDKFNGILDIYIKGIDISHIVGVPPSDEDAVKENPPPGNANIVVRIDKTYPQLWKLTKGTHYEIAYKNVDSKGEEDVEAYVVFADNSRQKDPISIVGTDPETKFLIDPECEYANDVDSLEGSGLILPHSPTGGILVEKIYVSMLIETPSIEVYHPDGVNNKAREIAESLEYLVTPLVVVEEPAPIAFNGEEIDQTQSIKDHDPTTAQDFEDTDLEVAMDEMQGNGTQLSLSFLDLDGCKKLSDALKDYFSSSDNTVSTYVCAPGSKVSLGEVMDNGGIANSIVYSYQDSNSYTISVNAGPKILGNFAQVSGGPSPKATEELSAKGTIIEDMGNHVHYKVRIDGFGERVAMNMAPAVLRVGDKVQVSVHNVPVES